MKIITISGLDGSGKSTQIKLLQSYLESQGKKVFYFHAIQFGLANKISGKNDTGNSKSVIKANWFQIQLRKIFLKIDICRFKKLYKKLKKEGFDYIISDRFFHDSIINICYLENSNIENCKFIENCKLPPPWRGPAMAGKIENFKSFYLQTSPEIIMQRERKPDQGIEYLQAKKILYDQLAPIWNLKVIDGNRTPEEIFEELKKLI